MKIYVGYLSDYDDYLLVCASFDKSKIQIRLNLELKKSKKSHDKLWENEKYIPDFTTKSRICEIDFIE